MRDLHPVSFRLLGTVVALLGLVAAGDVAADDSLRTVAERSDYQATSRHDDVLRWCDAMTQASPLVRRISGGRSHKGRPLPALVVAEPPLTTPGEASRSEKLVVLIFANIHAGEVDGKEAVMQLVRDLSMAPQRPLLQQLVLVVVPNLNADGNERMQPNNRPGQAGPVQGMGTRESAQGFDLNRDFIKLESPEIRGLVELLDRWDPHVVVDCHTTNGSYHRHVITYDVNRNPASDPRLIELARDKLTPDFDRRLESLGGWKGNFYGNFAREHTEWESYDAWPRFSTQYVALRQRIAVLSESYTYSSYKDRVNASRDFCRAILETAAERRQEIQKTLADVRRDSSKRDDDAKVALRHRAIPLPGKRTVLGWEEKLEGDKTVRTDVPRDYSVTYVGGAEATHSVARPYAYLIPESFGDAIATLQRHGVRVEQLREDLEMDVEIYRVQRLQRAGKPFQNHALVTLDVESRKESRRVPHGTRVVMVDQPLATLACYLLEPSAEDGLATWNYFDAGLAEGGDFPVLRLPARTPLLTGAIAPPPERRVTGRRITMQTVYDGGDDGSGAGGSAEAIGQLASRPMSSVTWLEGGTHYLESRQGRLYKVEALTGRKQPFLESTDKLRAALAALPTLGAETAERLSQSATSNMNAARNAALWQHENDLYYATLDGDRAVRLTATPEREELTSFSPDGRFVSFVRNQDLFVVDVATATERRLTVDGGGKILNGKADWVYFEELFHRNERAHWWSPDSKRLIFLRTDDTPVASFTVLDPLPPRQPTEVTAYPKAGDPLPVVQIGIVTASGGTPVFAKLDDYSSQSLLVARVGFTKDGKSAYAYLLNRQQTWLDFVVIDLASGEVRRLFREQTKAWVEDHGPPEFLSDGSFLFASERDGYKHLYHYGADGTLRGRVTTGAWEVLRVHQVDEKAGRVVFTANKESWRGSQLYSVKLDGADLRRIGDAEGTQSVTWNVHGGPYVASVSSSARQPRTELRDGEGRVLRTLDSNPLPAREEFTWGRTEDVQIGLSDGFTLEGRLVFPPDFDAGKKYPVWVKTYGGPHAPTVRDAWHGGDLTDQAHASAGFLVFHVDPRPASGKGAISAWTAYRSLGKQELADLEAAVRWLATRPYVDEKRVGLSGYSYGGYLTSYALTHSNLFTAGIAGAPVTDWRNYDAIYTERYMDTPQENPDGYKASSAVLAAGKLHGRLLLVHGVRDDNVHVQNTLQLLGALQAADKYAEVQFYPSARHGVGGKHFPKLSFDFMRRALQP